jgi:hypothetical protein
LKEIRDYLVEVELKIDFLCENFMAQIVLNTRKLLFLSNHEIIWNKNRIFAHSIINKNDRNEETDSYDYGNISHDGSLGSGTAIP